MIGRIVGRVLGSAIGRQNGNHPVAGAVIGAGTLFAARRLFPQRYAVFAATAAAAYLTKKWAERAEARLKAEEIQAANAKLAAEGGVDTSTAPIAAATIRGSLYGTGVFDKDGSFRQFMRKAFGVLYARDARTRVSDGIGLLASGRFFGHVKVSTIASNLGKVL